MKIGKTKTHHKLYVTERELRMLWHLYGEGHIAFMTSVGIADPTIDTAAVNRVTDGLEQALAQSLGGESGEN